MNKQQLVISSFLLLIIAFVAGAIWYDGYKGAEIQATIDSDAGILERDHSPTIGNPNAKVTIVEFFDPACETCAAFHPFVKEAMAAHRGKIRLVLRYAPFHRGSDYVVQVLEAAKKQRKFWEALDAIYAAQPTWANHSNPEPHSVWLYLGETGLDLNRVRAEMKDPQILASIQQDIEDGRKLQVTKTPGFFVNGKPLEQFGYQQLQQLIESEIAAHYP